MFKISKEAREILIKKERIYIGWNCCRVQDYLVATKCYKCHNFGHTAKYCRNDKEAIARRKAMPLKTALTKTKI